MSIFCLNNKTKIRAAQSSKTFFFWSYSYGGSINRGTPSYHPFIDGISPNKDHPASLGIPHDELDTPLTVTSFICWTLVARINLVHPCWAKTSPKRCTKRWRLICTKGLRDVPQWDDNGKPCPCGEHRRVPLLFTLFHLQRIWRNFAWHPSTRRILRRCLDPENFAWHPSTEVKGDQHEFINRHLGDFEKRGAQAQMVGVTGLPSGFPCKIHILFPTVD